MDVFSLRDTVVEEYRKFATSFTRIRAEDIQRQVEAIYSDGRYWPEPLIQINPNYQRTTTVAALVKGGVLEPACAEIFPLDLYKHQEEAIALAKDGESFVVTTGTGSGKSLCFFIPIVSAVLTEKKKGGGRRTRAVIVYPMNALANSQRDELDKYLQKVPGEKLVTYARYTGQETEEERAEIAENPPDILLTNFMMLELLMTRQGEKDRRVIANCAGLRFLVLDELHTYRGRQGADVALLVRRVRERLAPEKLLCIGTSATMASQGTREEKNRVVAAVASKLFAVSIPESSVIGETLERVTEIEKPKISGLLGPAIDKGISPAIRNADLRKHPLAAWVETNLGIQFSSVDHRWERTQPRTVSEAVEALAKDAGRSTAVCESALRAFLLLSAEPESKRTNDPAAEGGSFFAFKLHQFISGAGHAFATLEPPPHRQVTVEGQQFLPTDASKRLYPVHFCRTCGHEYHPVRWVQDPDPTLLPRDIDDAPPPSLEETEGPVKSDDDDDGRERLGFATLHSDDPDFLFKDEPEKYPEAWLEVAPSGELRLKANYRKVRAEGIRVSPSGAIGTGALAWFLPGKFRFCLRCGEAQTSGAAKDRTRLASLSAEGRSSATTVLVSSALRWMHAPESGLTSDKRKLLGFTDNRQDAALQSGHFNDFLFVSLLRAGFLGALDAAGAAGLTSEQLGNAQQKALGFDRTTQEIRAEWLSEPSLKGINLVDAEGTLRQVLAYRVWFDQRRGWRYTNPNLEQLGLVRVDYRGLTDLCADESEFANAPAVLRTATPAIRAGVYRELFNHLRQWMAIKNHVLDTVDEILLKSHSRLRSPWGFGPDEKPRRARWMLVRTPPKHGLSLRDEDLFARGGYRSGFGKTLRASKTWGGDTSAGKLKQPEYEELIDALLRAAKAHGLVSEEPTAFDLPGWRLSDACIEFRRGTPGPESDEIGGYFRDLYANLAALLRNPSHPLFGFEAREHTAQVDQDRRVVREKRFRFGEKEREELATKAAHLKDIGEANRFLPVLFCSPTMELGVDISALNAVYLRNVPPTPANYAQRSGRAGRSGQAALVLAYCSAQSPHDQYFFREPRAMVHGAVRPPLLDLANRDLVESHLHAVWLSCTEQPLDASISELLVLPDLARPLKPELLAAMSEARVQTEAARRIGRVLDLLLPELTPKAAPWFPGRDEFTATASQGALKRFGDSFGRWRDLFSAAEEQRDAARITMDSYAAKQSEKAAARSRHSQAIDQITLLQQGTSSLSSDFYTYRYLATEGFLPGYNFPRLPLMAYVPATPDGRGKQTYLQRPRFLALAEFGPRSLVYHEGRAYRVTRALLSLGHRDSASADAKLPVTVVRICQTCGGAHLDDEASVCHACGAPLGDAEIVRNVYRIENVATSPAERITANDEERQRMGFELQTVFAWALRDHVPDVRRSEARDVDGAVIRLHYGPGATVTRLNKGLRRRKDKKRFGFTINPITGWWSKNEDEESDTPDPTSAEPQLIVPSVRDHKNALLVQPVETPLSLTTMATVQHALLRGLEAVFQLEQGELLAEPLPTRDKRNGFLLYEATEGGAGVLTRLVSEQGNLATVAREALKILHFDVAGAVPSDASMLRPAESPCVAACYRCLMSYYNQPDHEHLDRRDEKAQEILVRLAHASTSELSLTAAPVVIPPSATGGGGAPVKTFTDPVLRRWQDLSGKRGLPAPDAVPLQAGAASLPLVWRSHYVVAVVGGQPVDTAAIEDRGFEVVDFGADEASWDAAFTRLATTLGK